MTDQDFRSALRRIPVFAGVPEPASEDGLADLCREEPLALVRAWLLEALAAGEREPHAMSLATVDPGGRPSSRVLLCKDIDGERLYFATDAGSRKGHELDACPAVAVHFHWVTLGRQVRVTGRAEALDRDAAERDFAERSRASQLAAAAYAGGPHASLAALRSTVEDLDRRHPGAVPCPPSWTVYGVVPDEVELWHGSHDRLHRRAVFRGGPGAWTGAPLWQ